MKTRRIYLGMVGVVSLALSGGATGKDIDLDTAKPTDRVRYAKETVVDTAITTGKDDDETRHYNLGGAHSIKADLGVVADASADDENVLVKFELDGMVFRGDSSLKIAIMRLGEDDKYETISGLGVGNAIYGLEGDSRVEFRFKAPSTGLKATDKVTLPGAEFAIDAGGEGSITMMVKVVDRFSDTGFASNTASFSRAVRLETALTEDVIAESPQVKAASNFVDFGLDSGSVVRTKSVGSVKIGVEDTLLNAQSITPEAGDSQLKLKHILSGTDGTISSKKEKVTFEGDFSFVAKATLSTDCKATTTAAVIDSLLVERDEDGKVTNVNPQAVDNFDSALHLCLTLSDKVDAPSVPKTENYTATTSYTGLTNAVFPPKGKEHKLGRITRDGTTVHIPYLTTYDGYNHRITLSNRSSRDTKYTFTFRPENDVMATPGNHATGDLAAGETKVLRAVDVVTLEGKPRTAATVTLPTEPSNLDVSTTLVNKSDGVAVVTVHLSDDGLR